MAHRPCHAVVRAVGVMCLLVGVTRADPAPPSEPIDVPLPGQENGGVDANEPQESTARAIARGALFVPRLAVEIGQLPFEGAVYLLDRYQLDSLYYRTFYNDHRTFGIVPTAAYQTGYGLTAGAELVATDVLGEHEHLALDALYGGAYSEVVSGWADSGQRLGRLVLRVDGDFIRRPRDPFYGIGNGDLGPRAEMTVDPLTSDAAYPTYLRYQELRVAAAADVHVIDGLRVIGRVEATSLAFADSTMATPVTSVYAPDDLVGFEHGVEHAYGELEVRWDRRRPASILESTQHATGWLASGFAGRVHRLDGGADFTRYGVDVQDYLHLGLGPRMLVLRLLGEGVTGTVDQVPFNELPRLGGDFLRGYPFERFRDRIAVVGTAQYVWDLMHFCNAYLFVDAGRVYSSLDAMTLDRVRIGYGIGIDVHAEDRGFLFEGRLGSSLDGGLVLSAAFNPIFDQRPRWR